MKTNQIMERKFFGDIVRQEHLTDFFCINDITKIGNSYRKNKGLSLARWDHYLELDKTKEFFTALMQQEDIAIIYRSTRGRSGATWAHPLVFFDYAMWISPDFKVRVYKWLYDNLTIFRDESGESYKQMASALQNVITPSKIGIELPALARDIKAYLKVDDWNKCDSDKLKDRDKIHNDIILLMRAGVSIPKIKNLILGVK